MSSSENHLQNNFGKIFVAVLPIMLLIVAKIFNIDKFWVNPQFFWVGLLTFWLILWWLMELAPLGITALVPLIYLPLFKICSFKTVAQSYASPVIFLFLGGMLLARALEKTELSKRLALSIIRLVGKTDRGILLGHILATTLMSMWISNTATTMIMLPIAVSVLSFIRAHHVEGKDLNSFATALVMSIAFSATIGGILTPVGTPPNFVFLGHLKEMFNQKIFFHQWFLATLPIAVVMLVVMYLVMVRITHPFKLSLHQDFHQMAQTMMKNLGPMTVNQKVTLVVFSFTASLWMFAGPLQAWLGVDLVSDEMVAICGGILLFLLPIKKQAVLDKEDIAKIPWNILLLFGGGMALAQSFETTGLLQYVVEILKSGPIFGATSVVLIFGTFLLFVSEFASNVALCNVALPFILTFCQSKNLDLKTVGLLCALATSFGFALPMATPPNAIAFGSGHLKLKDMLKVGLILDVVGVLVLALMAWLLPFFPFTL